MDFSRMYRIVANGVMTEAPLILTYYYVVSMDSVCLDFFVEGINVVDIMACDVGNEYLNALC